MGVKMGKAEFSSVLLRQGLKNRMWWARFENPCDSCNCGEGWAFSLGSICLDGLGRGAELVHDG
jgi:hypothetical protein